MPRAIPRERYTSREFLRLERERLWPRVWLCAGHVSQAPSPGDWFVFDHADASFVVVRGDDGALRAFVNSCPHRGTLLCDAPQGASRHLRCPYHAWEWTLDGALHRAPGGDDVVRAAGPQNLALAPAPTAVRLGFVWVALAPPAEDIDAFLAPVAERMARWRPEEMHLQGAVFTEVFCNWKASSDVSNESYHLRSLHPTMLPVVDVDGVRTHLFGRHAGIVVPLGTASGQPADAPATPAQHDFLRRAGATELPRTSGEVRPALQRAVRERARREGIDLSGLADDELSDKHQFFVFPNLQLNFVAGTLEVYRHRPHADDPCVMYFDQLALERVPPGRRVTRVEVSRIRAGERSLGPIMDEDVALLPRLQRGLRAGTAPFWCGDEEAAIAHMHATLERYLGLDPTEAG